MKIPDRILVMGNPGSGKSTFSTKLSLTLDIPYYELDAIHWQKNWQMLGLPEFRQRIQQICSKSQWVIDGNYPKARDLILQRVDRVIILDLPIWKSFLRLLIRSLSRNFKDKELWNGNRESFRETYFSKDSLLLYALRTYRHKKQHFIDLVQNPEYAQINIVYFSSENQILQYLARL